MDATTPNIVEPTMLEVVSDVQTDATTPNNVGPMLACWSIRRSNCVAVSKETMCNARTWPQQSWKSCANGSIIVVLRSAIP